MTTYRHHNKEYEVPGDVLPEDMDTIAERVRAHHALEWGHREGRILGQDALNGAQAEPQSVPPEEIPPPEATTVDTGNGEQS